MVCDEDEADHVRPRAGCCFEDECLHSKTCSVSFPRHHEILVRKRLPEHVGTYPADNSRNIEGYLAKSFAARGSITLRVFRRAAFGGIL